MLASLRSLMFESASITRSLSTITILDDSFVAHPSFDHLSTIQSRDELLKSYTVTPPTKPWPQNLYPKRVVSQISHQHDVNLAIEIFDHAGKYHPGFQHNYETYFAIIRKLARARAFDSMESLLIQLHKTDIKCSENMFVVVIRNYGIASQPKQALQTFLRMKDYEVQRTVRSFNTLLNAMVQNRKFDLVHILFKNCRKKLGIIPNVSTGNILVKALCKKDDIETALKVLDEMPGIGIIPNVVTYTTILGAYVSRGDMMGAKRVFEEIMDRGWLPDATTYTILMDGFVKQGQLIDAVKVMDDMEENGVEPNEVTYSVMIDAFCRERKCGEALNLLGDMLDRKYIPCSTLCCKLIDILCKEGKVVDAYELWKKLLRKNCNPDNAISSTLIHWLCKNGKITEAKRLFDDLEKGSVPSVLTYNALFAGLCESGELCEAGRLWDDMVEKGYSPNAFTYDMLIKGFSRTGNPKEGIRFLDEMLENGCLPSKSTYSTLIEGLCGSGLKEEAFKVLFVAASSKQGIGIHSWEVLFTNMALKMDDVIAILDELLLSQSSNIEYQSSNSDAM